MKPLIRNSKSPADIALAALFIAAVFLPLSDSLIFKASAGFVSTENRALAQRPAFSFGDWGAVRAFPKRYEEYFNDHFGFRNWLVRLGSLIKVKYLKVSSMPAAIIGKKGWFFLHSENAYDGVSINDYRGLDTLSPQQLETIKHNIGIQTLWLARQGIKYYILIAPNKHSIYPEYMPDSIQVVRRRTRYDQIIDCLKESNLDSRLIDVRDLLRQAKAYYPVYYKTDHHWNRFGAFVAVQALVGALSENFEGLEPLKLSHYKVTVERTNGIGNLARILAMVDELEDREVWLKLDPSAVPDYAARQELLKTAPKIMVFGDSFFDAMKEFMAEHFDSVIFAKRERLGNLNYRKIETEKPDAVVLEMVESYAGALQILE